MRDFGLWILDFGLIRIAAGLTKPLVSQSKIQNPKSKIAFILVCTNSALALDEPVTFTRDIAPIIFNNCIACHRPDQAGPFPLLLYDDVRKRATQIADVTRSKFMPPWLPHQGAGTFVGERGLSRTQIALIQAWAGHGAPEGDPKDLPPLPKFTSDQWPLGQPDLRLTLAQPYTVPAEGSDLVRSFVLPVQLPEDSFIKAIDVRPGNPRVIHHAAFLIDTTGGARMLDQSDAEPGYPGMGDIGFNIPGACGVWSPASDAAPRLFPSGVGRGLPKTCDLVMEVHFNALGKPETIQPQIGVYLAKEPVTKPLIAMSLGTNVLDIAPGDPAYIVRDSIMLPVNVDLHSIGPHAHYICKKMNVSATLPDGTVLPLLRIPDWDFNFQQEFRYAQPIHLPAGAKIDMEFVYDNSASNPRNPRHPPVRVRDGPKPSDEMGIVFLHVTAEDSASLQKLEQTNREKQLQRFESAKASRQPAK